ncbi:MAG: hypothetical protein E7215_06240 [Clostridium sulfidigenes]|uniref:Uncharacterized protein n=1 Tax=Clostridium sulfidigenes TaxID=318464 RepID=A0A927ZLD3_9CLOT|nr:hypothetical protein [Clostridium sulfidigenes]
MEMCIEKNIVSGKLPYDNFSVPITLVKAAKKLGWKESLVKYYVASLKKKKMLSRNGTSHNGTWVVSKD